MPKTNSHNIYRFETTDRNGYNIRIDMIPCDSVAFSQDEIITLDEGLIQDAKYDFEYNIYRHGAPKTQKLELSLNVNFMTPEFYALLEEPYLIYDDVVFGEINLGNIWKFYYQYTAGGAWNLFWIGVQNSSFEESFDYDKGTIDIGLIDAGMSCLQNLKMSMVFEYSKSASMTLKDWTREIDKSTSTEIEITGLVGDNKDGYYLSYENFWNGNISMLSALMAIILRATHAETFSIEYGGDPVFYKQLYDGSGERGAALTYANTLLMVYIVDTAGDYVGGFLKYISDKYSNFYEFYSDFLETIMKVGYYDCVNNIYRAYELLEATELEEITNDDVGIGLIADLKLTKNYEVVQKTRGVYSEAVEDDYGDIAITKPMTRNGNIAELNILFNNTPVLANKFNKWQGGGSGLFYEVSSQHETGLYYYDATVETRAVVRIHELPAFNLGDSISSDDLFASVPYIEQTTSGFDPAEHIASIQLGSGIGYLNAYIAMELFSDSQQTLFEGTAPLFLFRDVFCTPASGYVLFNPQSCAFSNIPDMFGDYETEQQRFYITKLSLDLFVGTVEFEALNRTYC